MTKAISGVGLGLRWPFLDDLVERAPAELSWLEIAPENYMGRGGRFRHGLDRCMAKFPIVTHGLALSLGGFDPLDKRYLDGVGSVVQRTETPWHSDHLCFSTVDGVATHDLLPVPFHAPMADHVADRIRRAQDALAIPLAVENTSSYAVPPGSTMSEAEFVTRVLERADCQLLLDVNNVYVNARNHGFDPRAMIGALPLGRVCQIHVAGHEVTDRGLIDTHAESISEDVFELLAWTLERTGPKPILLERDGNFPDWDDLVSELRRLDRVLERATRVVMGREMRDRP